MSKQWALLIMGPNCDKSVVMEKNVNIVGFIFFSNSEDGIRFKISFRLSATDSLQWAHHALLKAFLFWCKPPKKATFRVQYSHLDWVSNSEAQVFDWDQPWLANVSLQANVCSNETLHFCFSHQGSVSIDERALCTHSWYLGTLFCLVK